MGNSLVPGEVYGRVVNERMMKISNGWVTNEQVDFMKGTGLFQLKSATGNRSLKVSKSKKLFVPFMDLEKP